MRFLRYRSAIFFSQAGMRDDLTLPLGLFFSPERVCETILSYHLAYFFPRAGTRDDLTLPLGLFFLPSGHARRSHITTWPIFFPRAGMRDNLTLPLGLFFLPSGHARRSHITALNCFFPERACENLWPYLQTRPPSHNKGILYCPPPEAEEKSRIAKTILPKKTESNIQLL
jgi:hypothetical protein